MLLAGKFSPPQPSKESFYPPILKQKMNAPRVLIQAPVGYLHTGSLHTILRASEEPLIWLRFGQEDADPAAGLLSLLMAFRHLDGDLGAGTFENMRIIPGPIQGWANLYAGLADEIREQIDHPVTLILEHLEFPAQSIALQLINRQFLPALPDHVKLILITKPQIPTHTFDWLGTTISAQDLRLTLPIAQSLVESHSIGFSRNCLVEALNIFDGRVVGLDGVCCAAQLFGEEFIHELIRRSRKSGQLLKRIIRECINIYTDLEISELSILTKIGYSHPDIFPHPASKSDQIQFPWRQALNQDWSRLYGLWQPYLRGILKDRYIENDLVMQQVAKDLCENDAAIDGINLLMALGQNELAASYLDQNLASYMDLGFWNTLETWVVNMPAVILDEHPWLYQARGEIRAARKEGKTALEDFYQANYAFQRQVDLRGVCISLLAISSLEAVRGNHGQAWAAAILARNQANVNGYSDFEGWAEFQLGRLTVQQGDTVAGLEYFKRAVGLVESTREPGMQAILDLLYNLTEQVNLAQANLITQRKALEQSEREIQENLSRLMQAIHSPPMETRQFFATQQWLQVPLMLKLTASPDTQEDNYVDAWQTAWNWIQRWLGIQWGKQSRGKIPFEINMLDQLPLRRTNAISFKPAVTSEQPSPEANQSLMIPTTGENKTSVQAWTIGEAAQKDAAQKSRKLRQRHILSAYLLGHFYVGIDDELVEKLPTGRSRALMMYLIHHHKRQMSREELMNAFWPDADPQAARNSLNVAVYNIRQSLREVSERDILFFDDGKYFFNPTLEIWVDVDDFEKSLEQAYQLEKQNEQKKAIKVLEVAANLYQGDFLIESLTEEWTVLPRERLRLAYLDALYQLCRYYFDQGEYAACAAICQTILERDRCREDVHCLLMRCYARQDQFLLGLRQYQTCVDALRQELDVEPAESTVALYLRLRRREHTRPVMNA